MGRIILYTVCTCLFVGFSMQNAGLLDVVQGFCLDEEFLRFLKKEQYSSHICTGVVATMKYEEVCLAFNTFVPAPYEVRYKFIGVCVCVIALILTQLLCIVLCVTILYCDVMCCAVVGLPNIEFQGVHRGSVATRYSAPCVWRRHFYIHDSGCVFIPHSICRAFQPQYGVCPNWVDVVSCATNNSSAIGNCDSCKFREAIGNG